MVLMRCVLESIKATREGAESFPEMEAYMAVRGRARMAAIARKHCPESMVDDAVQESLAIIWQAREKYDPARGEFGPWAGKIVMRCAMRLSQRPGWRMSESLLDEELDACEGQTEIPLPEDCTQIGQFRRVVEALLHDDPEESDLLTDLFSSDKPRSQVMLEHMIVSDEALRQRLHRAREKFLARMQDITTESEQQLLSGGRATIEDWERIVLYRAARSRRMVQVQKSVGDMDRTLRRFALVHRAATQRQESKEKETSL